ncbi:MAG: DUF5063 domain-containing protein [Pyrinomonadaceae bacterium]
MNRDDIREAILFFLEVIEGEFAPAERETRLQFALDKLALARHYAEYNFDENDYPAPQTRDYGKLRELISPQFPNCGYYNVAHKIAKEIGKETAGVGDAIDDICDIAGHMEDVLWCWDNTSVDDALWHFKESYGFHWGKHLRDLQLYLYAKESGW